ncbi:MAG: hypothetical protein HY926_01395 [Elusimicrobia bacterium]|nr:hypothetical protein [Elusimicrobiota bacterium]
MTEEAVRDLKHDYIEVVCWVSFLALLHPMVYLAMHDFPKPMQYSCVVLLVLPFIILSAANSAVDPFKISAARARAFLYFFGAVLLVFSTWVINSTGGPAYSFFTWLFGVAFILAYCLGKSTVHPSGGYSEALDPLLTRPVISTLSLMSLLCIVLVWFAQRSPADPPPAATLESIWGATAILWSTIVSLFTYHNSLKRFF